ncbi:MAG: glycogen/starch/alpha-glucan phosphorylase, partial [Clostridiales Family XIII bacterium]|nr:glycogen/starch/alpha-glucan phosphorylase [Clostridiales Family XIII bacterium]
NIFIFGARVEDIERIEKYGHYNPRSIYERNGDLRRSIDSCINGMLPVAPDRQFHDLYHSLLDGNHDRADKYFLLYDFESYDQVYAEMMRAYGDRNRWRRMTAANTVNAGVFFADRTILEYNEKIWGLRELERTR